jgi:hypothetical protein
MKTMKVKEITYSMLRKTDPFENDRVEVTIELKAGEKVESVVKKAKELCVAALKQKICVCD